jgi:hypothetical protein
MALGAAPGAGLSLENGTAVRAFLPRLSPAPEFAYLRLTDETPMLISSSEQRTQGALSKQWREQAAA